MPSLIVLENVLTYLCIKTVVYITAGLVKKVQNNARVQVLENLFLIEAKILPSRRLPAGKPKIYHVV